MTKRKKSLWLQLFVFLIIFVLLFSVIGVVVVYLRGIQDQSVFSVPVTTTPNDEAVTIIPQGDGAFTITDTTAENSDGETINFVVGEDGTIVQEDGNENDADAEVAGDNEIEANTEVEVEAEIDANAEADAENDTVPESN